MYDEPDDDYMTSEQASEAGWVDPDTIADVRALIGRVDLAKPEMGNKAFAALVLVAHRLGIIDLPETDPTIRWALYMVEGLQYPQPVRSI